MRTQTMKAVALAAVTLGVCIMTNQANAGGQQNRGVAGDRYGYEMYSPNSLSDGAHLSARDPFCDGSHVTDKRNPFTDGAHGSRTSDPLTDGAHSTAARMNFAGMDFSGVSAPPALTIVIEVGA